MTVVARGAGHDGEVASQPGPGGQSASLSWCACGWRGPVRDRRADAIADVDAHVRECAGALELLPDFARPAA